MDRIDGNSWRFCIVGNIKHQHLDENGRTLFGSKAFSGGTKVYIDDRTMGLTAGRVSAIGLNRFHRYAIESIEVELIENVRVKRIFKPGVLRVMDAVERLDGWTWRGRTAEDRKALEAFVEKWNNGSFAGMQGSQD